MLLITPRLSRAKTTFLPPVEAAADQRNWKNCTVTVNTIMLPNVRFAVYVTVKGEIEWNVMIGQLCPETYTMKKQYSWHKFW